MLLPSIIALLLVSPGDTLIRTKSIGKIITEKNHHGMEAMLTFPFDVVGDFASGDTTLSVPAGTAITIVRSSAATYATSPSKSTIASAAANRLRVEGDGAFVETTATNFQRFSEDYNTTTTHWADSGGALTFVANACADPLGGTTMDRLTSTVAGSVRQATSNAMPASTGPFTASVWVRSFAGVGAQTMSGFCFGRTIGQCACTASDGSTCTATPSGSFCAATITVGTTPVRLESRFTCNGDVTIVTQRLNPGTLGVVGDACYWGAQVEPGPVASSYIPTTTTALTRQPDAISFANPLTTEAAWCFDTTAKPDGPWGTAANPALFSGGTDAGANSFRAFFDVLNDANLDVYDNAGGQRRLNAALSFFAESTHRMSFGTTAGILTGYADGSLLTAVTTGGGTGVITTHPAAVRIGAASTVGTEWNGNVKRFRVFNGACSEVGP